jgi:hypothetical protein
MRETINTIAQVVVALCAVGVLLATVWKIPRHLDTKIAILRLVFTLSAVISLAFCVYFAAFTDSSFGLSVLLALYALLVNAVLFITLRGAITRAEILSMILTTAFVMSIPGLSAINHILTIEGRIIGVLEKMSKETQGERPQPTPAPKP